MIGGDISVDDVLLIVSCIIFLLLIIFKSVDTYKSFRTTSFSTSAKVIFYMILSNYTLLLAALLLLLLIFAAMWVIIMFVVFLLNVLRNKQPDVKGVSMFTVQLFLGYLRAFNYKCVPIHFLFLPFLLSIFVIFFVLFLYKPTKVKENQEGNQDITGIKKIEDTMKQYFFLILLSLVITAIFFIFISTVSGTIHFQNPSSQTVNPNPTSERTSIFKRLWQKSTKTK